MSNFKPGDRVKVPLKLMDGSFKEHICDVFATCDVVAEIFIVIDKAQIDVKTSGYTIDQYTVDSFNLANKRAGNNQYKIIANPEQYFKPNFCGVWRSVSGLIPLTDSIEGSSSITVDQFKKALNIPTDLTAPKITNPTQNVQKNPCPIKYYGIGNCSCGKCKNGTYYQ